MSAKKQAMSGTIPSAIKMSAAAFILTLAMLLLCAALILGNRLPFTGKRMIAGGCLFLSCVISGVVFGRGEGVKWIRLAAATAILALLLMLMSAAIPDGRTELAGLLPLFILSGAGFAPGTIMQFNKKYTSRRKHKRNITNRNHRG